MTVLLSFEEKTDDARACAQSDVCLLDNVIDFRNTNPLDSRLFGGECYTP